ncbi:PorH family porin [Corynebacterium camporealensis]
MDIAVVQAALSNFSTFVDNVIDLFQGFPEFIQDFADFFAPATETVGEGDAAVETPVQGEDGEQLNNGAYWANQTSSIFE